MCATLTDFSILRPPFELSQETTLNWLAKAHAKSCRENISYEEFKEKLFRLGLGPEKIQRRGLVTQDCFHEDWDQMDVSRLHEAAEGVCLKKRMEVYDRTVSSVFEQFYQNAPLPKHLIHVTCTGYVSPSGAQKVAAKYNPETVVTHAYHMGCYAAIPAIRMALQGKEADIVHTELCTLHLNPSLHDTAQLVVQTLFADGFIKYSIRDGGPGLKVLALQEELIPDSDHVMSWKCESWGLKMTLAKELPVLIARALPAFVQKLMMKAGVAGSLLFAIHPGGPKIIEQVGKVLGLEPWQIAHSRKILQGYGNMSSATLPHIWDLILKDEQVADGTIVVSLSFGPGLTICGGVFQCGR